MFMVVQTLMNTGNDQYTKTLLLGFIHLPHNYL